MWQILFERCVLLNDAINITALFSGFIKGQVQSTRHLLIRLFNKRPGGWPRNKVPFLSRKHYVLLDHIHNIAFCTD